MKHQNLFLLLLAVLCTLLPSCVAFNAGENIREAAITRYAVDMSRTYSAGGERHSLRLR